MQFYARSIRAAALAAVSMGVLAACADDDSLNAPAPLASAPSLALALSSANAAPGQRIAIAIDNISNERIGGVHGVLRFDASKLQYRGQEDADNQTIFFINDKNSISGTLSLALLDGQGIDRSAALVFDVIGSGYAASLDFDAIEVAVNGSPIRQITAEVADGYVIDRSLLASPDAKKITFADWSELLAPTGIAMSPGNIIPGLKYGDTDGNGLLALSDALYLVNVFVGLNELIIGTDGTGLTGNRDGVVAGNTFPYNINGTPQDLGEAGDPVPPGLETLAPNAGLRLITLSDALAIVNEFVGNNQPVVGEVIPGRPATPVSNRVIVNTDITVNTTWTANNVYELVNYVSVTNGATLTIQAGTQVEGRQSVATNAGAALYILRDGKIDAQGTPLQPIVFTCTQNAGEPSPRVKGCWGGVSILGSARINDGTLGSPVITGRAEAGGCLQKGAEGEPAFYGGCNDDDNSGILRYSRIEYAGFRFTATNELNGLALYGVGRGTTIDHVQVHAGKDDNIEMFGGTVNMKYMVSTAGSDDAFDFTEGWNGDTQFLIIQLDGLDSDNGFENDNQQGNNDALPRSTPTVYNVTMTSDRNFRAGTTESQNRGLLVRRGSRPHYFNFIVEGFTTAVAITDASTCVDSQTAAGFEFKNSLFALNNSLGGTAPAGCGGTVTAFLTGNGNTFPVASPLLSPLSYTVPDFRPVSAAAVAGGAVPTGANFDASATYIGAVAPSSSNVAPWYSGWTRGWQNATTP